MDETSIYGEWYNRSKANPTREMWHEVLSLLEENNPIAKEAADGCKDGYVDAWCEHIQSILRQLSIDKVSQFIDFSAPLLIGLANLELHKYE